MITKEQILANLNPKQKQVVTYNKPVPLEVEAGAGSGKSTVLAKRIEYLHIINHVPCNNILAVTFTRKATQNMKEKLIATLGKNAKQVHIETFHSLCIHEILPYSKQYQQSVILSKTARMNAVQSAYNRVTHQKAQSTFLKDLCSQIDNAEDKLITPNKYLASEYMQPKGKFLKQYLLNLKKHNLLDYGSVITNSVKLLKQNPKVLHHYQNEFKYILVDEYQDTNHAQATLIRLLADKYKHLTVFGDANQCIFGFSGADINNMLQFTKRYPFGAHVIYMARNYRSTQNILDGANAIIHNNEERSKLHSFSNKGKGNPIDYCRLKSTKDECKVMAKLIKHDKYYNPYNNHSKCVILARTNSALNCYHQYLTKMHIPNYVISSVNTLNYKDIQDILNYLYTLENLNNVYSLERIINRPTRGIGNVSQNKWIDLTERLRAKTLLDDKVISNLSHTSISKGTIKHIYSFKSLIMKLFNYSKNHNITQIIKYILKRTDYMHNTKYARKYHINLLMHFAKAFDKSHKHGLKEFLNYIQLASQNSTVAGTGVPLMTIHSAKGLEFPAVFLAGLNEGVLPLTSEIGNDEGIQSERRLMYVAMTRAEDKLYLLSAHNSSVFGEQKQDQSQFINEMKQYLPPKVMHTFKDKHKYTPLHVFKYFKNNYQKSRF